MCAVFISYRREDTAPYAGRIFDRLAGHFGRDNVFLDIDAVKPGQDFVQVLEQTLEASEVVVVVIGRGWSSIVNEHGHRRLQVEGDYVRQEIAAALNRSVPIIPVLVGRAAMPRPEDLPEPLVPLARRQAIEIDDAEFHQDVDRLIKEIGTVAGKRGGKRRLSLRAEPAIVSPEEVSIMLVRHNFFCAWLNEAGTGIANQFESKIAGNSVVVVDHATGLMWQKNGSGEGIQGSEAAAYVKKENEKQLAGFADWRLPTLEEAMSVNTVNKHGHFHLNPVFDRSAAPFIWTADTPSTDRRWMVYYADGCCQTEKLSFHAYIRLVRSASQ